MKRPRHFLSYALTRTHSTVLRTQADGTWLRDKFLTHDVTKHIFCNAFACWNKWAWRFEQQVKEGCHMFIMQDFCCNPEYTLLVTAILDHRISFQQTQIMGNTDVHAFIVTGSTSLFKDKITGEIPDMVQQEPWWWSNYSSTLEPIKTLQSCSQRDDRKQTALCLCNPPASVWHLRLQIPQVQILILWANNDVLSICHW